MPDVGDVIERFGRAYIFLNPDLQPTRAVSSAVGTWRLRVDDEGTPPVDGDPNDPNLTFNAVVGGTEPVIVGNLIYLDADGKALLADATSYETSNVAGMVISAGNPGEAVKISRNEPESIFDVSPVVDGAPTFLTIGAMYYLSTTPGKWTTTPDTTTPGAVVRSCGTALDTNKMSVEIQVATVI